MVESVAERIGARFSQLPKGERRAAQALVTDYPLAGLKTVAEFASAAGVSAPTILRFVSRIGFSAYAEFQGALKQELAEQIQSPLSRAQTYSNSMARSPFLDAVADNLQETFRHLPEPVLEEVASRIADWRLPVFLAGGRFTDAIARYMTAHLRLVRPDVHHLDAQFGSWRDKLVDISKGDVLIAFDVRRYQQDMIDFAADAAARGATVILVTDQWLSPVARFARHVLACRTAVPSQWDSTATLFVLAEHLIERVSRLLGPKSAKRLAELERLRK